MEPVDIMVIARFNHYLKKVEIRCGANEIPTEYKAGGVRFYSAHASKGSECKHVVLADLTSGLYGFPCEIEDSSVMELAKRFESDGFIEEERRLFYVALTRSKKFLYLFTLENSESMFLDEIDKYLKMIYVDSFDVWSDFLSEFMNLHMKGAEIDPPMICPECGKKLERRCGKYGEFLGCVGYPQCKYIHDLVKDDDMRCPLCGRKLVNRKGKYGEFLGCIGYPECKYTEKLNS